MIRKFEGDSALVRVGSPVTVTTPADAGPARHGKVSYIDPQVNAETRTVDRAAQPADDEDDAQREGQRRSR